MVEEPGDEQPRAGGHLGDDRVGDGGLHGAGAAAVPELQVGQPGQGVGDLAPAHLELGHRRLLEATDQQRLGALARHVVRHAGDLALVGHRADQHEARTGDDRAGEGGHGRGVVQRGALGPDVLAAQPQPGVDVDGDPDDDTGGGARRVHGIEVRHVVDHEGDRGGRRLRGRQARQRPGSTLG